MTEWGSLHLVKVTAAKILDINHADVNPHEEDISGSVPDNCVMIYVEARRQGASTGVLRVYPDTGAEWTVLNTGGQVANRSALGGWVSVTGQVLKIAQSVAGDDWDVWMYAYMVQG